MKLQCTEIIAFVMYKFYISKMYQFCQSFSSPVLGACAYFKGQSVHSLHNQTLQSNPIKDSIPPPPDSSLFCDPHREAEGFRRWQLHISGGRIQGLLQALTASRVWRRFSQRSSRASARRVSAAVF